MNKELRSKNYEVRKIQSFTDLITWQKGHELVLIVYHLTASFPREEQFGLISQMRRSAVSFTSNIAEGFSRNTIGEKRQFYGIALGSLTELHNQILVAKDLQFILEKDAKYLIERIIELNKMTNSLIKNCIFTRTS